MCCVTGKTAFKRPEYRFNKFGRNAKSSSATKTYGIGVVRPGNGFGDGKFNVVPSNAFPNDERLKTSPSDSRPFVLIERKYNLNQLTTHDTNCQLTRPRCMSEAITCITYSHQHDRMRTFVVIEDTAEIGWSNNYTVFAIDCAQAIGKIPPLESISNCLPLFDRWRKLQTKKKKTWEASREQISKHDQLPSDDQALTPCV